MMDTCKAVMMELESAGSEQTRKTYRRHGAIDPMFGVSYATLGKIAKRIKRDHELAIGLWKTGNHDARVLATMIADPARCDKAQVERWLDGAANYILADAISRVAVAGPSARQIADEWLDSTDEWRGVLAWNVAAGLLLAPDSGAASKTVTKWLKQIEKRIHSAPNRVRHSMNMALIATGMRGEEWEEAAIAAARRIGKVNVDHGNTECKTPDAETYILKANKRRNSKLAGRKKPA